MEDNQIPTAILDKLTKVCTCRSITRKAIKEAIDAAIEEGVGKFGGKKPNKATIKLPLRDGDILQLGMDFRGGTEEIYRCVRMRIELNRSWKLKANSFNKEALQRLQNLQKLTTGVEEEDCSICLCKIKPCQAIFISPCAHSWHFRCVRRLVMLSYPQFVCPNCRSVGANKLRI